MKSTDTILYLKIDSVSNIDIGGDWWLQFSIMAKASESTIFIDNTTLRLEDDSVNMISSYNMY